MHIAPASILVFLVCVSAFAAPRNLSQDTRPKASWHSEPVVFLKIAPPRPKPKLRNFQFERTLKSLTNFRSKDALKHRIVVLENRSQSLQDAVARLKERILEVQTQKQKLIAGYTLLGESAEVEQEIDTVDSLLKLLQFSLEAATKAIKENQLEIIEAIEREENFVAPPQASQSTWKPGPFFVMAGAFVGLGAIFFLVGARR